MICAAATIWGWKRNGRTVGWINTENYQYVITALLLMAYGMLAYLLGDERSFFDGFHLSNTMTVLALGIITLAKVIVEVKREMDGLALEEWQDDREASEIGLTVGDGEIDLDLNAEEEEFIEDDVEEEMSEEEQQEIGEDEMIL
jgi:hypothetical protein